MFDFYLSELVVEHTVVFRLSQMKRKRENEEDLKAKPKKKRKLIIEDDEMNLDEYNEDICCDYLESDLFKNIMDKNEYKAKYICVRDSPLFKKNYVSRNIIKNIAEYSNGLWINCWKCQEKISFLKQEIEENIVKECLSEQCQETVYLWNCWMNKLHWITINKEQEKRCAECDFQVCNDCTQICPDCTMEICESCWSTTWKKCWNCFEAGGGLKGHISLKFGKWSDE